MNSNNKQLPMDSLERELKAEAIRQSPPFSLSLHQRVMRGLKTGSAERTTPQAKILWWPLSMAAVAAVLVVAILLGRLWTQGDQENQEPMAAPDLPLASALESVVQSTQPLQQQLKEARFGYVDQDARRLGQFVVNQLDLFPSHGDKDRGM